MPIKSTITKLKKGILPMPIYYKHTPARYSYYKMILSFVIDTAKTHDHLCIPGKLLGELY